MPAKPEFAAETPKETSERIISQIATDNRHHVLNKHVRDTLDDAMRAMRRDRPDQAMDILAKSSDRYIRLGGERDPHWVPADQNPRTAEEIEASREILHRTIPDDVAGAPEPE